jgi:hypothetical protein
MTIASAPSVGFAMSTDGFAATVDAMPVGAGPAFIEVNIFFHRGNHRLGEDGNASAFAECRAGRAIRRQQAWPAPCRHDEQRADHGSRQQRTNPLWKETSTNDGSS